MRRLRRLGIQNSSMESANKSDESSADNNSSANKDGSSESINIDNNNLNENVCTSDSDKNQVLPSENINLNFSLNSCGSLNFLIANEKSMEFFFLI